jgi:hypothetical protein
MKWCRDKRRNGSQSGSLSPFISAKETRYTAISSVLSHGHWLKLIWKVYTKVQFEVDGRCVHIGKVTAFRS